MLNTTNGNIIEGNDIMTKIRFSLINARAAVTPSDDHAENILPRPSSLFVIEGDKARIDELLYKLVTQPEFFDREEFEHLCDVAFKNRLSNAEVYDLRVTRLEKKKSVRSGLERNILLAIIYGDDEEHERLSAIIKRRNQLGLTVIHSDRV
jgi:hypothetical protein